MDVTLSFFSIVFSFLLRFNFETEKIDTDIFTRGIVITVSVYLLFFYIFRSFKEIIRHTTVNGVLKIFLAVVTANLFLLTANAVFSSEVLLVPNSVTLINFFISAGKFFS